MADDAPLGGPLIDAAIAGFHAYVRAINTGDRPSVEALLYTPPGPKHEKPRQLFAERMCELAPIEVVSARPTFVMGERTTPVPHSAVQIDVALRTSQGSRSGRVHLWCLPDGRVLVGARNHGWHRRREEPTAAAALPLCVKDRLM